MNINLYRFDIYQIMFNLKLFILKYHLYVYILRKIDEDKYYLDETSYTIKLIPLAPYHLIHSSNILFIFKC